MTKPYDAIVIGSGPNGLAAAITLARRGWSVLVYEANKQPGGGVRSMPLTLPGFIHDTCSSIYPFGTTSAFFRDLPLHDHGLEWILPAAPLAHPFDDGSATILRHSVEETARELGPDGEAYFKLFHPITKEWESLREELLAPLHLPSSLLPLLRFGLPALRSAGALAHSLFRTEQARVFFLGLAAHAILPFHFAASASFALVLGATAHTNGWPFPKGGAQRLTDSLISYFRSLGGELICGERVTSLSSLPPARAVLFDTSVPELLQLAEDRLPSSYSRSLRRYRRGPGVFKIDWALRSPIPWKNPLCATAGTVHLGATSAEITLSEQLAWDGGHAERPFVLLAQHTLFDPTRAPEGHHTAWAYCHVPTNSTADMTEEIETQVERFAPGFRDTILARHTFNTADLARANPNLVGGDITGGANTLRQLFARPVLSLCPYRLPAPGLYLCSASTPPGGGVHGMCGYFAARQVLRDTSGSR